jgi:asparagine synthase (glutamine-hydrolysing)
MARREVTVCLSGDGGDELFCGYDRYLLMQRLWRYVGSCPTGLRKRASSVAGMLSRAIPLGFAARKFSTLAEFLAAANARDLYTRFHAHWKDPAAVVVEGQPPEKPRKAPERWLTSASFLEQMMYVDSVTYLPDDLLVKIDRASMAVSLEVRVPLLDHRLVASAWQIPLSMKYRDGVTKWLLRRVLARYVPRNLIDRPKMGFGVPIDAWLRGPLREWAEDLLNESRLRREGFLRPEPIRSKWEEHLTGRANWHYLLWDILMFQAWLGANRR